MSHLRIPFLKQKISYCSAPPKQQLFGLSTESLGLLQLPNLCKSTATVIKKINFLILFKTVLRSEQSFLFKKTMAPHLHQKMGDHFGTG
uniref:Uncharacterized protein n=1 Tax=Salvator merianae TaxID=96440 RepID=A0A8D0BHZ7_SALMN